MRYWTLAMCMMVLSCSTPKSGGQDVAGAVDVPAAVDVSGEVELPDVLPEAVLEVATDLPDDVPDLVPDMPGELPVDAVPELVPEVVDLQSEAENVEPFCGDGECGSEEACDSCPDDCGICTECGNGLCEGGQPVEDPETCPEDCGSCGDGVCGPVELELEHFCAADCATVCGDGVCADGESVEECPPDCGGCNDGCCGYKDLYDPDMEWCKEIDCSTACGDGQCTQGEDWLVCPVDCGWCGDGVCGKVWDQVEPCPADCETPCGDGLCNGMETATSCPGDCGPCGDGICGLGEQVLGTCPWDCPPECGNDKCEEWESPVACPQDCGCVPLCDPSWECGLDAAGCGQLCGGCPVGSVCVDRMCCVPESCKEKQCGADGCGGSCGFCPVGWSCLEGTCAPPLCVPDCGGLECGNNGCGGSCGLCDDGLYCTNDVCVAGACLHVPAPLYCVIDGLCRASGEANPFNECGRCKPALSHVDWTALENGYPCAGNEGVCSDGVCCNNVANCLDQECGDDGCGGFCGFCPDGWGCKEGVCEEGVTCHASCVDKECGDDGCGGSCGGCDDGLQCTADLCLLGHCQYTILPLYCLLDEVCVPSGAPDPADACRKCLPGISQTETSPVVDGMPCDDGDACTGVDFCQAGLCVGPPLDCDDGAACTADSCVPGVGCAHAPVPDLTECGPGMVCLGGTCIESAPGCPDGNNVDWDGCTKGVLSEFLVNTHEADDQRRPVVATPADGSFVVAWQSNIQDNSGWGIFAQRYDSFGLEAGGEFQVNETTALAQSGPDVAALTDGRFIIAWSGQGADDDEGVYARIFDADGQESVGEKMLNVSTVGKQTQVQVVAHMAGSFGAVWTGSDDWAFGIKGGRYKPDGSMMTAEMQLNEYIGGNEYFPAAGVLPNGYSAVVWVSEDINTAHRDIFGRVFNSIGAPTGTEFQVGEDPTAEQSGVVLAPYGVVGNAGFVVVWSDDKADGDDLGLQGQRYSQTGILNGSEFGVNDYVTGPQELPAVAARDTKEYIVTWSGVGENNKKGVFARRFGASGNPVAPAARVNVYDAESGPWSNDVAYFDNGQYVVVWENQDQDGDGYGVFALRFNADGTICGREACVTGAAGLCPPGQCDDGDMCTVDICDPGSGDCSHVADATVCNDGNPCTEDVCVGGATAHCENTPFNGPCNDGDACTIGEACDGGTCQGGVEPNCNDKNPCTVDSCSPMVGCVNEPLPGGTSCLPDLTCDADFHTCDNCDDGNPDPWDGCTAGYVSEFRVNIFTSSSQDTAVVDGTDDGRYGVAWVSYDQFGTSVVMARHFGADGQASNELQVSPGFGGYKWRTGLAMNGNGDFVVVYGDMTTDVDGSGDGVYATFYDKNATKLGDPVLANTHTDKDQHDPAVAALNNDRFVVVWESYQQEVSNDGIYGQMFSADGGYFGSEFHVNTYVLNAQEDPEIGGLANGNFVVVWESFEQDGSSWGVYGQVFDPDGNKVGEEFHSSTTAANDQDEPSVAGLAGGGFVVAWSSLQQDGSMKGVYGQLHDNSGDKVGEEFQIHTWTDGNQERVSVAALDDGGFVAAWDTATSVYGDSYEVFGQFYDAGGSKAGGEFWVNSFTQDIQSSPSVAMLSNVGFVVAYVSQNQAISGTDIFVQRFNADGVKLYH